MPQRSEKENIARAAELLGSAARQQISKQVFNISAGPERPTRSVMVSPSARFCKLAAGAIILISMREIPPDTVTPFVFSDPAGKRWPRLRLTLLIIGSLVVCWNGSLRPDTVRHSENACAVFACGS